MIKVQIDEAAAFDMLSILELKSRNSFVSSNQYASMLNDIVYQVGSDKFNEVKESELYRHLLNTNSVIFNFVDLLNEGKLGIDASVVHILNTSRYKFKQEIQNKYFTSELAEEKI